MRDMSERVAKSPTLFSVPAEPSSETVLLGTRCSGGHVAFPPEQMGCEVCGAHGDEIETIELAASGTLTTFAMAHRQQRAGSTSPLVVGTVVLDAGPAVDVVLDVDDTAELSCGLRVVGNLVPVGEDESGRSILDCFFSAARSSEASG
jgi:uncharacterized OB-fold protein